MYYNSYHNWANGFENPTQWGRLEILGGCLRFALFIFFFLGILYFFVSCASRRIVTVEVNDSTATHVHTHTVFVPDTVFASLPPQTVYRITPDTASHLETDYASSDASIVDGLLHHSIFTKPTPVSVAVHHRETTRDSIVYREREVPVPVPVIQEVEKPLTRWQQARLHFANFMFIALALAAAVWLLKKRAWWLRLFRFFK